MFLNEYFFIKIINYNIFLKESNKMNFYKKLYIKNKKFI